MTVRARVIARRIVAEGVVELTLAALPGEELPVHEAGAHVDITLPNGLVRSYSLLGNPAERDLYRIAILREDTGRGGSRAVHDLVKVGHVVDVTGPRNAFPLREGPHHVLLAGGIGITPLLAMAWTLAAREASFVLHYAARSAVRMAYREELAAAPFARSVRLHTDDDDPLDVVRALADLPAGTNVYTCGPAGFIAAVKAVAAAAGVPAERIHHEHFGADPELATGGAVDVFLAKRRLELHVAANESIADALLRAGVDVPVNCSQGVCGTCMTTVLEGIPEHRDQYLLDTEKAANNVMTVCCSRARTSRLVLDL